MFLVLCHVSYCDTYRVAVWYIYVSSVTLYPQHPHPLGCASPHAQAASTLWRYTMGVCVRCTLCPSMGASFHEDLVYSALEKLSKPTRPLPRNGVAVLFCRNVAISGWKFALKRVIRSTSGRKDGHLFCTRLKPGEVTIWSLPACWGYGGRETHWPVFYDI